jgi:hypothetical protein
MNTRFNCAIALVDQGFTYPPGLRCCGGQGRGRTVDLPIFSLIDGVSGGIKKPLMFHFPVISPVMNVMGVKGFCACCDTECDTDTHCRICPRDSVTFSCKALSEGFPVVP